MWGYDLLKFSEGIKLIKIEVERAKPLSKKGQPIKLNVYVQKYWYGYFSRDSIRFD